MGKKQTLERLSTIQPKREKLDSTSLVAKEGNQASEVVHNRKDRTQVVPALTENQNKKPKETLDVQHSKLACGT
jgi:hypothetical protein